MKNDTSPDNNFYSILGLEKTCSSSEVRCAYKRLAKKWHPDKLNSNSKAAALNGSSASSEVAKTRFQAIQEAYSVLSDNNKRLMYDAGVYDDDDDELEMGSFMGEMAAMMACTRQEGAASESLDDLKAMFLDIIGDNCYRSDNKNKRQSASFNDSCGNCPDMSSTTSNSFVDAFCVDTKVIESGKGSISVEDDSVDGLHELKQMFMNVVDPGFYTPACSEGKRSPSIHHESGQWMDGQMTFEELVAETLFPDGLVMGSNREKTRFGCKRSSTLYEEANFISTKSTAGDRCTKRQKICTEGGVKFATSPQPESLRKSKLEVSSDTCEHQC